MTAVHGYYTERMAIDAQRDPVDIKGAPIRPGDRLERVLPGRRKDLHECLCEVQGLRDDFLRPGCVAIIWLDGPEKGKAANACVGINGFFKRV